MKQGHVRLSFLDSGSVPALAPERPRERRTIISGITRGHGSEIALLAILIVTASIGVADRFPVLSVGISLETPDILLVGLLGYIAARWLAAPEFKIVRTPLDRPLLVFYGVTLFSTFIALVQSSVDRHNAISSLRIFTYYLTFFAVTNLVKERRQLNFLLNGILVLATIVALAMIGQYLLGGSVQLLGNEVGGDYTPGGGFDASRRVAPPGVSIVLVSFVTTLCILVLEKFKPLSVLRCLQCGLLGMALLMTFFRSYFAGLIVVMLLMGFLVRGSDRRRLIGLALSGLLVMLTAVLVLYAASANAPDSRVARLLDASWDRYSTLGRSGTFEGGDNNVEFRKLEYGYAWPAVASSPIIGLGLGAAYRPLDPRLDGDYASTNDHRRLIHNGHMTVLLQSGLLGYLSLTALSLVFLVRGFRNWRHVPNNRLRAVVLGFTMAYLAILIAASANSLFIQPYWTPVIGMMLGINEVILRQVRPG